ncbi:MAG: ABC transporter permease subunit [Acidobacteriota bacterium]
MLVTIIRKEILEHVVSLRFFILVLLCIVLIPLGFYVNFKNYSTKAQSLSSLERDYLSALEESKKGGRYIAGVQGFRKTPPLNALISGYEDSLPNSFSISKEEIEWRGGENRNEIIAPLFGHLDLLFIINIVITLMALLMSFDSIVGEKEKGTLRLTLSNSSSRSTIILGKLLGGYITILIPYILSVLIGILILLIFGYPLFDRGILFPFIGIIISSFIQITLILHLGMFISSRTHSSLSAFTFLLFIWVILFLGIPRLSGIISKVIYPVKDEIVFKREKESVRREIEKEKGAKLVEALERENMIGKEGMIGGGRDWWNKYRKLRKPIVKIFEEKIANSLLKLQSDYDRRMTNQQILAVIISRISPASCFAYLLSDLAGTGPGEREKFFQSVRTYQNLIEQKFWSKTWQDQMTVKRGKESMNFGFGGSDEDIPRIYELPLFSYSSITIGDAIKKRAVDLAILIIYTAIFFVVTYYSFIKYDVR